MFEGYTEDSQKRYDLLKERFKQESHETRYPYGRYRGDVKSTTVYVKLDNSEVSSEELEALSQIERHNHDLGGVYKHSLSDDKKTLTVKYHRHSCG